MARKKADHAVSVHEIPPEVVGAVVLADLAQIRVDGETHPDPDARRRIMLAADRLQEIATNSMTPATVKRVIEANTHMTGMPS